MCGIIGYTGHRPAVPLIMEGLRRLEYRGYDSAGVAFVQNGALHRVRAKGKLASLEEKLSREPNTNALAGIGHTRWATHGAPEERNAHPHLGGTGTTGQSESGKIALIHNGIFENFQELKEELTAKGVTFQSETDTEVLAHLIAEGLNTQPSELEAFAWALRQTRGAYAVAMISPVEPNVVYAARNSAPLLLGVGTGENFVASDIPAFLPYTRDVVFLQDGEVVRITPNSWEVLRLSDLAPVAKEVQRIQWDLQSAQKGGYRHFMLKEIFEQPKVIADCLVGRLGQKPGEVHLEELDALPVPKRIHIVACGTSYHAGMWARNLLESWAHMPVMLEIASEFRYRDMILDKEDMVLVISQSGETADTLAALRLAKERGCPTLGLCNVIGSSIARETATVIYTQAGPEISVASTKAMCSQMVALTLMALYYGRRKNTLSQEAAEEQLNILRNMPNMLEKELPAMRETATRIARSYSQAKSFFFLGRGHSYPLALEGALKLKELSYIHAEGYAAGEMKHGPIALIDPQFPSFVIVFDDALAEKTVSNVQEVQARSGPVIALTNPGVRVQAQDTWIIPRIPGYLAAFMALPALQLFSYEAADYLGNDVDQPRNLAKSVVVE